MIANVDKFKALAPKVYETDVDVVGKYSAPEYYLFYYDKLSKDITIHSIKIIKQYDNEGKLYVSTDWSSKYYKTEKPALKALSTCMKNIKEFDNLCKVTQINEDF
jgi:hypothetical protein